MDFDFLVGPVAACYGDDDPTERLLVFRRSDAVDEAWRVSLTHERVEIVRSVRDIEIREFPAEHRRQLLEERAEIIGLVVNTMGFPPDFAA